MRHPMVTIGLPTFNAAKTLHRTLDSIINQTYNHWILYISDDFSNDETVKIIEHFVDKFPEKIQLLKPEKKLYYMNFRYLLDAADTPYFVWLAGDDWWEPTFLEDCIATLEADPHAVCCVGRCLFHDPDGGSSLDPGCQPMLGDMPERMTAYLLALDSTRMYGVFRRQALSASFPPLPFHAYDWALCLGTLRFGTHRTVDKILINRERTPTRSYIEAVKRDEPNLFCRLFPAFRMTWWLMKTGAGTSSTVVFISLLRVNIRRHEQQVQFFNPRAFRVLRPMYRLLYRAIDVIQRLAWALRRGSPSRS